MVSPSIFFIQKCDLFSDRVTCVIVFRSSSKVTTFCSHRHHSHRLSAFQLIVCQVFFVNSAAKMLDFHQSVSPCWMMSPRGDPATAPKVLTQKITINTKFTVTEGGITLIMAQEEMYTTMDGAQRRWVASLSQLSPPQRHFSAWCCWCVMYVDWSSVQFMLWKCYKQQTINFIISHASWNLWNQNSSVHISYAFCFWRILSLYTNVRTRCSSLAWNVFHIRPITK